MPTFLVARFAPLALALDPSGFPFVTGNGAPAAKGLS